MLHFRRILHSWCPTAAASPAKIESRVTPKSARTLMFVIRYIAFPYCALKPCQTNRRMNFPSRYKYVPDAHTNTIEGSFGVYGPGAFVEHIEINDHETAISSLDELEVS